MKKCPLLTIGLCVVGCDEDDEINANCKGRNCAWWDEAEQNCYIASMRYMKLMNFYLETMFKKERL